MKPVGASIILPDSLLIDPTKEPLQIIINPYKGFTSVPADIATGPGLTVFLGLQECFKKAGFVAEGMLANIIWGFEHCGHDPKNVAAGLTILRTKGYITYTDANRVAISEFDWNPNKPVWIRYTNKFTEVFVR